MSDTNRLLHNHFQQADRLMTFILAGLFIYALVLASWYDTWTEALIIGGATLAAVVAVNHLCSGSVLSRALIGAAFMVMSALHIHQAQGLIEIHFGIFVLLAILLFYRDATAVICGALTIAVHHFTFYYLQDQGSGVWVLEPSHIEQGWWIIFLHAGYVVVETIIIVYMCFLLKRDALQSAELSLTTSTITSGNQIDLSQRSSGSTPLLTEFDAYTEQIDSLVKEVHFVSDSLVGASTNIHKVTTAMEKFTKTQATETDMIASAVEEMTAAITEVSDNANNAAKLASQVDSDSRSCREASERTVQSINLMAQKIQEAVHTIDSLNQKADSIGGVVNVIRSVADQTNLLALNAAIEAARAGEQGRGFAVVADEVRTLAQRSQESTEEIDNMIEELQAQSLSAVSVIQSSQSLVETCVDNTQETLQLMNQVGIAINEINSMNTLIATATHEQTLVTQEISKNINNIVTTGQEILDETQVAADSSRTLDAFSKQLTELSRRFLTSA